MKLGRNDPCHCGSGKKYKHCHYEADRAAEAKRLNDAAAEAAKAHSDDETADGDEENHDDSGHGKHQGSRFIRESGRGKRSPGGPGGGGSGAGTARINRGSQRGG